MNGSFYQFSYKDNRGTDAAANQNTHYFVMPWKLLLDYCL